MQQPDPAADKGAAASTASTVTQPTHYTRKLGLEVCKAIATSTGSFRGLPQKEGFPTPEVFSGWLMQHETLRIQYALARELQAELLADEVIRLADGPPEATPPEDINRTKLRIETRKWMMSKLAPAKYGDKPETAPRTATSPIIKIVPKIYHSGMPVVHNEEDIVIP